MTLNVIINTVKFLKDDFYMNNKIKEYRLKQGLTLEELANSCNLSIGYISHLETGTRTNPSLNVLNRIAQALNINISELLAN